MKDAVIVAYGRSAVGKAPKGALKDTRPDELAAQVIRGIIDKVPGLPLEQLDDFILGCAFPEAEQGLNVARTVGLRAGLPISVAGQTVNRFCSSGLQSIAMAGNAIMAGQADAIMAGGMESMSKVPMGGNLLIPNPHFMDNWPDPHVAMGITAENVAVKYGITRQMQDEFAMESHLKAAKAQAENKFEKQIIPVDSVRLAVDEQGNPYSKLVPFVKDEGVRANITMEALTRLPTVFKKGGTVTPGNASQMSDGAAGVVMMSAEKAKALNLAPQARFVGFDVAGVDPAYMGIGPIEAIPKVLKRAGLSLSDIGLIELNEAFASQSIACIRELDLNPEIVNVNGGAIALGHPLGCTGSFLTAKLLEEMERRQVRYGLVSMCIGGGMGAAAIFERL
ncbi:thiolase family protein [Eubacteriaceae bacterium ES3]|nr:thiolase family protein [Eubacteriaceae bacterium ES3]